MKITTDTSTFFGGVFYYLFFNEVYKLASNLLATLFLILDWQCQWLNIPLLLLSIVLCFLFFKLIQVKKLFFYLFVIFVLINASLGVMHLSYFWYLPSKTSEIRLVIGKILSSNHLLFDFATLFIGGLVFLKNLKANNALLSDSEDK